MKVSLFLIGLFTIVSCNTSVSQEDKKEVAEKVVEENFTEFYDNGQLKTEGKLINGKRDGLWKAYYQNGLKWSETTFKMGVKNGVTTTFFESGMMRYTGVFYNDERTGEWIFYNEDGSIMKKENFIEQLNPDSVPALQTPKAN